MITELNFKHKSIIIIKIYIHIWVRQDETEQGKKKTHEIRQDKIEQGKKY